MRLCCPSLVADLAGPRSALTNLVDHEHAGEMSVAALPPQEDGAELPAPSLRHKKSAMIIIAIGAVTLQVVG
jgi:hypothetical protein